MSVYTLGIWTARQGQEDEFIAAWQAMATATADRFPGGQAVLLRDRDKPNQFISSGPWTSLEEVERWRASDVFEQGVSRIRPLLESFEPHTMDPVVVIEASAS